jgi:hypothetical protein
MRKAHTKVGPEYKLNITQKITNQVFIHKSKGDSEFKQRKYN